jgi:hypothetical protein
VQSVRETIEELPIERIELGGHALILHEMAKTAGENPE